MDVQKPAAKSDEWVRENADRSFTVKLENPVKWGSETVTELRLRRPKGKDLRALRAEPSMAATLEFAGRLTEHPDALLDDLDVVDAVRVLEVASDFLPQSLKAGATS